MKDNYSEMNVDMEQILFSKEYDELTASEREEIKDFISSKEDFYLMKNTLMSVKNSFGTEEEIEPRNSSKEDLMKMFEQKHGKVVPMNKPRPFYLSPVFQIGVAALFVLGIIYFYPKGENKTITAMNETESKEESGAAENTAKDMEEELTESDEAMAEESPVAPKEAEKEVNTPAIIADVPIEKKAEVAKAENKSITLEDMAKNEGIYKKDIDASASADSTSALFSTVYRSTSKDSKEKEKAVAGEITVTGGANTVTTTTYSGVAAGGLAVMDELAEDKLEKKEADKKDGKITHTNTADGYYGLPGKPASDVQVGVSLKDKPALSEFLFTAL